MPGCIVRRGAYIAPGVVLMPSFVNLGAYVDEGTMVDTWATVGSCAQIGKHVHLSGGVGIGGVLEPLQANPTIIEDNCFIGARSEVVEGVVVGEGSVLAMGVFIGASTKIVDRNTGEIFVGRVPPYSVVVPGSLPGKPLPDGTPGPSLYCAVIVKRSMRRRERRPRSTSCCATDRMDTRPLSLAQSLLRCPSVTPEEGGALAFIASCVERSGFRGPPSGFLRARHAGRGESSMPASVAGSPICSSPGTPTWCRRAMSNDGGTTRSRE